jgi:Asp/Glu/hydantoin racemase
MNERIKQLWDDSIEEFSKQHQYATIMLPEPLRKKFAELIVLECAGLCNDPKTILEHFGYIKD